jgi:hypothetical protein
MKGKWTGEGQRDMDGLERRKDIRIGEKEEKGIRVKEINMDWREGRGGTGEEKGNRDWKE